MVNPNFKRRAAGCLKREADSSKNDSFFISLKTQERIEKALRIAYIQGVAFGGHKIEVRASKIISALKRGDCFCEAGIGNPMMRDHSEACKNVRKWLNE